MTEEDRFDYIVVGSGAGGGPVAMRLAESGAAVLLLEAGDAHEDLDYEVPAFHARSTENPRYSWEFFVRHFADDAQQRRDQKYVPDRDGVFYPRAGTLGGCTAHNAMITICPHNADWDHIAATTKDASWSSAAMRTYFERLERCDYVDAPRPLPGNKVLAQVFQRIPWLARWYSDTSRHGHDGWLTTSLADPKIAVRDPQIARLLKDAAEAELTRTLGRPLKRLERLGNYVDPNDWQVLAGAYEGLWRVPTAIDRGRRNGTREALLAVSACYPNLTIRTSCLVTRVLLDGRSRAIGVEYLEAASAYRADPRSGDGDSSAPRREVRADQEVILAGGAFNTPQLLMLSGIGPRDELDRHGIPVAVDSPGVGRNLQDRYEVGVVSEVEDNFALLDGLNFRGPIKGERPDVGLVQWHKSRTGVYATNGALLGITRRSGRDQPVPDLFIFALPADFTGYYPGYSGELARNRNRLTWAILKAYTNNKGGVVRLRSADPRDVPDINFHYFEEGSDQAGRDLEAVATGVDFVRNMNRRINCVRREITPGPAVTTREDIKTFVRDQAWGHHASCTARMGPDGDPLAVTDSRFRVRGTSGLRVVDASVFPKIPGFFIVTSVYMIAEKAADVILADAGAQPASRAAAGGVKAGRR